MSPSIVTDFAYNARILDNLRQKLREKDDEAHRHRPQDGEKDRSSRYVLGIPGIGVLVGARKVDVDFKGGIEAFSRQDRRDSEDDDRPLPRADMKPDAKEEDDEADGAVHPRVVLRAKDDADAPEGMVEAPRPGDE